MYVNLFLRNGCNQEVYSILMYWFQHVTAEMQLNETRFTKLTIPIVNLLINTN